MFNYFIPKGDTIVNGSKMELSIRSIKLIDNNYYIGYYLNNNPYGRLYIFDQHDSILKEIRNFVLWDTSLLVKREDNQNHSIFKPVINSNYIYENNKFDSIRSEYSLLYLKFDSILCVKSHIPKTVIKGNDIFIEKKDSLLYRHISSDKFDVCFEYKNENLKSNKNHVALFATDSTGEFTHYKLIEPYVNHSMYEGFHINDLKSHYESGKEDVLSEFYKAIINGESYYDEIDERSIYVPKSKGEIPDEIQSLRYDF